MSNTQKPNYRIYDRTGGGVTHDIFAESLESAIAAGREWIEDGDWNAGAKDVDGGGKCYQVGLPLKCEVGAITYEPDLSSIDALPAVGNVSVEEGVIIVEIDQEHVNYVGSALGARLTRVGEPDADGYARYAVCLAGPVPMVPVYSEERHDCSGEYSDPLEECEMHETDIPGDDDWRNAGTMDEEGHVWISTRGARGLGGTAYGYQYLCRVCGCYKDETDAGCQRNSGEPRGVITIRDRDEDSEAWLKQTHEVDGQIPDWLAEMLGEPTSVSHGL